MVDSDPNAYPVEALMKIKATHEKMAGRIEQAADMFCARKLLNDLKMIEVHHNLGNVAIDSPGAILAQTVNLKTTKTTIKINAPPGTIGADQSASRYVQHLIRRYNEFAGADKTRGTKFSYGAISKNIETNFKAPWKLVAMENFGALCTYLQRRIARTRIAKSNSAKGHRSFSSFEEYSSEQR
ncbi:Hypothetical protein I596_1262 [Dokdonella koreensis DS-123]|uniref:Uncharacterized protein n=2 Tax=Dokdonella TaxID=323413 RepID=A0A167GRJ6_9GAMM|nr:Hypothetical protein I596_1262 [Dokdonella koreensis DS-123]